MFSDIDGVLRNVENLVIDLTSTEDQIIDEEKVIHYKQLFTIFAEDECAEAITVYLKRLSHDKEVNDITRAIILNEALQKQSLLFNKE